MSEAVVFWLFNLPYVLKPKFLNSFPFALRRIQGARGRIFKRFNFQRFSPPRSKHSFLMSKPELLTQFPNKSVDK